ncbi:unnamed protein product [Nesidiocoris tenuis]|uniref:Uncharacterized protein n=1 Tax=Nesidiocoris tenuis TaxID=355587 RepID=A0A6H5GLB4_9HEMI|nr:unnamed protein product [Nesidiocoris tenuis]
MEGQNAGFSDVDHRSSGGGDPSAALVSLASDSPSEKDQLHKFKSSPGSRAGNAEFRSAGENPAPQFGQPAVQADRRPGWPTWDARLSLRASALATCYSLSRRCIVEKEEVTAKEESHTFQHFVDDFRHGARIYSCWRWIFFVR